MTVFNQRYGVPIKNVQIRGAEHVLAIEYFAQHMDRPVIVRDFAGFFYWRDENDERLPDLIDTMIYSMPRRMEVFTGKMENITMRNPYL